MLEIILIAHEIRSTHNVGSMLRTADGLGVNNVYLTGYTPYPKSKNDPRLPHLANKITKQIAKTALGAEKMSNITHEEDIIKVIQELKSQGYQIIACEQAKSSISLGNYTPSSKVAVIVGNEVKGLDKNILDVVDKVVEIPMQGQKESYNVSVSAAIALYHLTYLGNKLTK